MPAGHPKPKVEFDLNNPHHIRAAIELPVCRASLFVRTTLTKDTNGYVDGGELWAEYRRWKHRDPMGESAFLAALEKARFDIYADGECWLLNGWMWPNTAMPETGKKIGAEKTATREYTFTKETLPHDRLKELAMRCESFNGIAECLGWSERKFALYRTSFPAVEQMIEQVWAENPDRFKQDEALAKGAHVERVKAMRYRAMQGALAARNAKRKAAKAG